MVGGTSLCLTDELLEARIHGVLGGSGGRERGADQSRKASARRRALDTHEERQSEVRSQSQAGRRRRERVEAGGRVWQQGKRRETGRLRKSERERGRESLDRRWCCWGPYA